MLRGSLAACGVAGIVVLCCLLIGANGHQKPPNASNEDRTGVDGRKERAAQFHSGIPFGKRGRNELRIDIAQPAGVPGQDKFPTIVCLYGGGWILGDRQQLKGTIQVMARRGYVAVCPDYRLAPGDRFPAQIEDCKAAVRWLRANADKYCIDPQRIGVFGYSAGAHLACMLGVTRKEDGMEGKGGNDEQSSAVQAVVSFFGPMDLTKPVFNKEVREHFLLSFLGCTLEENPDLYRRASPLTYVGPTAPPFLFVHGTKDDTVPIEQSKEMVRKLREAGVSARLIELPDQGHGWGWSHESRMTSIAHMLNFFDEKLKK